MRTWLLLLALGAVACTDDPPLENQPDASVVPDAGDASVEAAAPLTHCIDRPNELPRPPEGRLPCELIPPGLVIGG